MVSLPPLEVEGCTQLSKCSFLVQLLLLRAQALERGQVALLWMRRAQCQRAVLQQQAQQKLNTRSG